MLQITVSDTGMGIKEEDRSKLFKLFGFLDATKELNTKGIGLGLHISRKIVQECGGEIYCQYKWGEGSAFTYLMSVEPKQDVDEGHKRRRNPNTKKVYAKIKFEP